MNRIVYIYIIGIVLLFLPSCDLSTERYESKVKEGVIPLEAPLPEYYHQGLEVRTRYAIEHYFDRVDWSDPSWHSKPREVEQSLRTYLSLVTSLTSPYGRDWLLYPLTQTQGENFIALLRLYPKLLGEKTSILYSPRHYELFADWVRHSPKVPKSLVDSIAPLPPTPSPTDSLPAEDSTYQDSVISVPIVKKKNNL